MKINIKISLFKKIDIVKNSLLILASLSLLWLTTSIVKAVSFKGLAVFPADYKAGEPGSSARFEFELYPGETKKDQLRIVNNTGKDRTFKLFPADGTTTSDGAFALAGVDDQKKEVGKWISLDKQEVFIPNEQETYIGFTINIPSDAEVGDHLGGVSVFSAEDKEKQEGEGMVLTIKTRVGVRIYITVPGDLKKKLIINTFEGGLDEKTDKVVFKFGLENQGNVRVEPKGEVIALNNFLGNQSTTFPIDLRMVLPGKPTLVPIVWEKTPLLGKFVVRANVSYGDKPNEVVQKEIEISYITKKAKVLIGVSLAILLILLLTIVKKSTTSKIKRR